MRDEDRVREHIADVGERDALETQILIRRMQRTCWPGGGQDRHEPTGYRWLRHGRPAPAVGPVPVCSCVHGRCPVCN